MAGRYRQIEVSDEAQGKNTFPHQPFKKVKTHIICFVRKHWFEILGKNQKERRQVIVFERIRERLANRGLSV